MKKIFFSAKPIVSILAIFILSFAGAVGLRIAIAAWTGPSAAPPGDNVDAPINVGSANQSKAGGFDASALYLDGYSSEININSGALVFDAADDGDWDLQVYEGSVRVGSGENFYILDLPSCSGKLYTDASGQVLCGLDDTGSDSDGYLPDDPATSDVDMSDENIINVEDIYVNDLYDKGTGSRIEVWDDMDFNGRDLYGIDKMTINTIDPLYNINGEKFATYMAAMTGVKEETTGNVNLKCEKGGCLKIIDFDKVEKGSDLWLFYQVTDFGKDWEDLVALLTPEGKNDVWYEINFSEHQLLIYGEKEGRVSYRLTALRFDYKKWPNISTEEGLEGMKVEFKNQ